MKNHHQHHHHHYHHHFESVLQRRNSHGSTASSNVTALSVEERTSFLTVTGMELELSRVVVGREEDQDHTIIIDHDDDEHDDDACPHSSASLSEQLLSLVTVSSVDSPPVNSTSHCNKPLLSSSSLSPRRKTWGSFLWARGHVAWVSWTQKCQGCAARLQRRGRECAGRRGGGAVAVAVAAGPRRRVRHLVTTVCLVALICIAMNFTEFSKTFSAWIGGSGQSSRGGSSQTSFRNSHKSKKGYHYHLVNHDPLQRIPSPSSSENNKEEDNIILFGPPSSLVPPIPTLPPTHLPADSVTTPIPPPKRPLPSNNKNYNSKNITLTPYKYKADPIPNKMTDTMQQFVDRWCDFTSGKRSVTDINNKNNNQVLDDWYATKHEWQRRAPAFLIPGVKYTGATTILAHLLAQHEQIVPPRTPHNPDYQVQFFLDPHLRHYVSYLQQVTHVHKARQRLYAHRYFSSSTLQRDVNTISFDATPGYLLYSTVTPRRLFCIAPWIKLVIVLQDPMERLIRHYYAARQKGLPLTFQEWVEKDVALAQRVGLLNESSTFAATPAEDVAWYEYTSRSLEGALGRSLYEIQLRHWFLAIMKMGRVPNRTVLLLHARDLARNPQAYYTLVLQFVGVNATAQQQYSDDVWQRVSDEMTALPQYTPPKRRPGDTRNRTQEAAATSLMSPAFRQRLETLFRPHQERLEQTLREYGMAYARPKIPITPPPPKV
ncbi:hypothetical protein ACA910_007015 [Epithemia clementina (nom. ined.)]